MSKKLKTTTNRIIKKVIIIIAIFVAITSVIAFTSNIDDRSLFANATLGDKLKNEETQVEPEIIETEEIAEEEIIEEAEPQIVDNQPEIIDTIYCVVSGDSYSKICKMFYDNEDLCWALMEYNGANGNSILHVGQELKIPDINNEDFKSLVETAKKPVSTIKKSESNNSKNVAAVTTSATVENNSAAVVSANYQAPTQSGNVRNNPGYVDTSSFTYLGSYKVTGYTPGCAHCCGNTKGITASGVPAKIGRTIAAKGFSFGTTLYIKGYGFYVVEDRGGFAAGTIDMAAGSHEECYSITSSRVDVYLVSNN